MAGESDILRGLDLTVRAGEVHAIMGPNGSGKSTFSKLLAGHPAYQASAGEVHFDGADLLAMAPEERARAGLFLGFQYPVEVPGVSVGKFLKRAVELRLPEGARPEVTGFIRELRGALQELEMDQDFINRSLNQGFSGGEKKRMEIVQMLLLKPSFAVLDETDSGLDIDALKLVAQGVNRLRGEAFGGLVITHYQRILNHLRPDRVHVMYQGRIVATGTEELVGELEAKGYDWLKEEEHEPAAAGR